MTALKLSSAPRRPAAPHGLRTDGRALWQQVTRRYALRTDELRTLEVAARTADELTAINVALIDAPPMSAGPRNRMVPNPLLEEARRHRAIYLRALAALGLGNAEADAVRDPRDRSSAGRALARQRWEAHSG